MIAGGAAAESLTLTAADGNQFAAALAESPEPSGPGVVILPDVRGLYRFYVELAERFAAAGHHAIAFDYFGRTAGAAERDEGFDWKPHVAATTVEGVQTDLAAARAALAERTGATQFAAVGFCFGGGHSFWAGSNLDLGLDAVVGFYGALSAKDRPNRPNLVEDADQIKLPVLGLFGGDDPNIPPDRRRRLRRRARAGGRRPRDRQLPRRPPLLLRPQAGGVRGGLDRRLDAGARLPRRRTGGGVARSTFDPAPAGSKSDARGRRR